MNVLNLLNPMAVINSMAGRIFVLLTVGMVVAATVSLLLADGERRRQFEQVRLDRVVASVVEVRNRVNAAPGDTVALLADDGIIGVRLAPSEVAIARSDETLIGLLVTALGPAAAPDAGEISGSLCLPRHIADKERSPGVAELDTNPRAVLPDCWVVRFNDAHAERHSISVYLPPLLLPGTAGLDPIYLLVLVAASAVLAFIVARLAASPLSRLRAAAKAFSMSLDTGTIDERGPREVKAALQTFNLMQRRVRDSLRDRTQLLAAVSHDLQTPLTRLRLRLEQIDDAQLKDRLVADLSVMQTLVREGLDLARSSDSLEDWSVVDIDSLVNSVVEDAAEIGAPVRFTGECHSNARTKPAALSRALTNLVDNAVKYGGETDVKCVRDGDQVRICVTDSGPGIPAEQTERMFEPFVRGEQMSSVRRGTGIGLTIARAQARAAGAEVSLTNAASGGLIAQIAIPTDNPALPKQSASSSRPFQRRNECLLRDIDLAELAHLFLALFLLVEELALAADVAAVAFGGDVFSEGTDGFARDDLAADRRLDGNPGKGAAGSDPSAFRTSPGRALQRGRD